MGIFSLAGLVKWSSRDTSNVKLTVRFCYPAQICEYSTTVSASACHAEDVSSILITRSSFRIPTSCVIVCSCRKSTMNSFTLAAFEAPRLVSVNVSMSLRLLFRHYSKENRA